MSTLHKIDVVAGLPKPVATLIVRVNGILAAMTANKTTFPTPPVALATVTAHVNALSVAESAMKTRQTADKPVRDAALTLVVEDIHQLQAYVQQLASASPDQAETIAAAAAMTLRKTGAHPKSDLTLKQTVSGTVHAAAKNVAGARAHEWQYSTDGGKTWLTAPATTKASTTLSGFTPGTLVQVRHRPVVITGPGDWSPPFTVAVS